MRIGTIGLGLLNWTSPLETIQEIQNYFLLSKGTEEQERNLLKWAQ
jgi:hypothetical protein